MKKIIKKFKTIYILHLGALSTFASIPFIVEGKYYNAYFTSQLLWLVILAYSVERFLKPQNK